MRAIAVAFLLAVSAVACGGESGGDGGRLDVVASFYPLAEAASRVGGDRVEVQNLTPVGVEPHDVELTTDQVDAIEDADVVIYIGEGFQPAVQEIARDRDGVTLDLAIDGEDPHVWLDPHQMIAAVDNIAGALGEASPADLTRFGENAFQFKMELFKLDDDFRAGLARCERRDIVTAHAAFHHLASRYDLNQLAITGVSPEAEPDAARLAELTDQIEQRGITTVFFEELVPRDVADALAREANVKTAVLSPIEGLSEEDEDAGKTYVSIMRSNLAALREALGCQ